MAGLLSGCATSTVETRRQERSAAYASLAPEMRAFVDQGKIKVGMTMDAVYIAWGKPSQILTGESLKGTTTTFLYHGSQLQEHRHWTYRSFRSGDRWYSEPYLEHEYYPRSYVRAEIIFEEGLVKEWRSLPEPVN